MTNAKKYVRGVIVIAVLLALSLAAVIVCVGIGTIEFSPREVVRAIFVEDDSTARLIVWNLRFPRILTGGLVGICLALAGCILQGVMRNNLASPSTIGVTGGASFVGYLTLVVFPSYSYLLPIGAMAGAFVTTMLIYALAYQKGVSPVRMILSGMAVSALFGAFNDIVKTLFAESLGNASGFLVGGLNGCGWKSFYMILPYALAGMAICLLLPSKMNILMLGDETANSLGLRTELFRFILIAVSSLLSGAAIAAVGMLSFVGLIVPHIARLLVGSDHRFLFPASTLLGFSLIVICDTVGRVIMPPGEVPVSIIISFIGAPFFLFLLRSRGKGETDVFRISEYLGRLREEKSAFRSDARCAEGKGDDPYRSERMREILTLLKVIPRAVTPKTGVCVLDSKPLRGYRPKVIAKRITFSPQVHTSPPDIDVRTLVSYGRISVS